MMRTGPIRLLAIALSSAFVVAGCNNGSVSGPDAGPDAGATPTINSFTATPSTTAVGGGPVTLAWDVTGATSLSIDQGVGTVTPTTVGSKAVLVGVSTVFTLTATDATGSTTATAPVIVPDAGPTTAINGTVVDSSGLPAPGQTVLITAAGGFSQTFTTDGDGGFTFGSVPTPYTATVIEPTEAIQYVNLTRSDPSLTAFLFLPNDNSATLSGQFVGGMFPETPPDYETELLFSSPQTVQGLGVQSSGAYSSTIQWPGPASITGTLYALQIHNVSGLPADYPGYGTLSSVSLQDGGTTAAANVTLSPVTTGTISGTVTFPDNYNLALKTLRLAVANDLSLSLLGNGDPSTDAGFSYVTPAVPGTTLAAAAVVTSAIGEFSEVVKTGLSANASGIALDIPAAPTLVAPANAATSVTTATTFQWTEYPSAVYELRASSSSGPTFYVLTAGTTANLPDLSGLPLPASTGYSWTVIGLAPVSSVDLLAAPGGINTLILDLSEGGSVSQTFTTGP